MNKVLYDRARLQVRAHLELLGLEEPGSSSSFPIGISVPAGESVDSSTSALFYISYHDLSRDADICLDPWIKVPIAILIPDEPCNGKDDDRGMLYFTTLIAKELKPLPKPAGIEELLATKKNMRVGQY